MRVSAVIVGAGSSTRMGKAISKQLIKLMNTEVIVHTLMAFEQSRLVNNVVVVCRNEDTEAIEKLIELYGITKVTALTAGGSTRQQSVLKGVNIVKNTADLIAIHDGARPLVLPKDIDRAVENACIYKAAALGVAVKDTIKVVNHDGCIVDTPDRSTLVSIQTPQIFETKLYVKAAAAAEKQGRDYTDDCQLIEALGQRVYVTEGSYTNIKVTTPEDIILAEGILSNRRNMEV